MVSTTLTTIAAGQPTSSSNHHHHSSSATSTANNSNYQRSTLQQQQQQQQPYQQQQPHQQQQHQPSHQQQQQHHSSSSTSNATTRNSYYYNSLTLNGIGNTSDSTKTANVIQTVLGAAETNHNSYHYHQQQQRPSTLYNGKGSSSNSATSATAAAATATALTAGETTTKPEHNAKLQRNETTTTKSTVNLSEALHSTTPPLNDQISLLFPKCRPKYTSNIGGSNINSYVSNGSEITDVSLSSHLEEDHDELNINGEAGPTAHTLPAESESIATKSELATSPSLAIAGSTATATSKISAANYYKNINIITQSPPPPSTSSVSSESLSSVTPRISTNPFLCGPTLTSSNGDPVSVTHKLKEEQEEDEKEVNLQNTIALDDNNVDDDDDENDEELPVPSHPSFYYHTSSLARNSETRIQRSDEKWSYEMPRKRSSYNSYNSHHAHSTSHQQQQQQQQQPHQPQQSSSQQYAHLTQSQIIAAVNHHQHQQQQQQQQHNGNAIVTGNPSQNPFIKDNYWETRHNITPASTVLNSPDYSGPEMELSATSVAPLPSSRRAYHQQTYSSNNYMPRQQQQQQQQQQQHHIRVGRSPVNHSEQLGESSSKISSYAQQQQQQQQSQNPCAEGLTPLASHYLYGSKTSLDQQQQQHVVNNGDWDKRDRAERERESRERDREQREQRRTFVERERGREHEMRNIREVGQHQQQQQQQQQQQHHQRINNTDGRLSVITNGEVVVFDDIGESWQNLRVTTDPSATRQNAPVTAPAGVGVGSEATSITQQQQQQQASLTLADIKNRKSEVYHGENETATMYKDHKRYLDRNYAITVETRHGIIEYEGSPRRIGQGGGGGGNMTPDEEPLPICNSQQQEMTKATTATTSTSHHVSTSANSNSPQQYPARPGFPQRIISPPRESTPPMMLLNYNNTKQQSHQQHLMQQQQQQQQQQHLQSLPQESPIDNNAEDTSNDVSEIGTISDLTTPEAISAAAAAAAAAVAIVASTVDSTTTTPTAATVAVAATAAAAAATSNITDVLSSMPTKSSTFDYLYEFSETRKVLEEFFKCPSNDEKAIENGSDIDSIDIQYEFQSNLDLAEDDEDEVEVEEDDETDDVVNEDIQQHLQLQQTQQPQQNHHHHQQQQQQHQQQPQQQNTPDSQTQYQYQQHHQNSYNMNNQRRHFNGSPLMRDFDFFLDSASRSSGEQIDQQDGINHNQMDASRHNYRYSPETTDYDSNCGDLDSLSGEINGVSTSCSNYAKYYASASMPVLEDGLSSGHTSDTENNNQNNIINNLQQQQNPTMHHTPINGGISMLMDMKRISTNNSINSMINVTSSTTDGTGTGGDKHNSISPNMLHDTYLRKNDSPVIGILEDSGRESVRSKCDNRDMREPRDRELLGQSPSNNSNSKVFKNIDPDLDSLYSISVFHRPDMVQMTPPPPAPAPHRKPNVHERPEPETLQPTPYKDLRSGTNTTTSPATTTTGPTSVASAISSTLNRTKTMQNNTAAPPAPALPPSLNTNRAPANQSQPPPIPERNIQRSPSPVINSPVWLPRHLDNSANKSLLESSSGNHSKNHSADEDDVDTDLETDRLLGHQRLDDQGYYDENKSWDRKPRSSLLAKISPKQIASTKTRNGYNALLSSTPEIPPPIPPKNSSNKLLDIGGSISSSEHSDDKSPLKSIDVQDCVVTMGSPGGSDGSGCISGSLKKEVEIVSQSNGGGQNGSTSGGSGSGLGGVGSGSGSGTNNNTTSVGLNSISGEKKVKKSKNKEAGGAVLIEGVLFRAKYLGSTQLVCEGQPTKSTRMMQAEEAVSRIKAPDGDAQPSTEVDLFISTEKIMVLNTDLKEIMMDHALRTISYIADIGDLVVLMARRRFVPQDIDDAPKPNRTPKMICHVFESDEAQFIAQSIGQAFQVAYMEFLKANGIEDHSFVKEMDYQEVLNSQEIFGDELEIFAKKELQKEVVVPKAKGEILGVVIVESGWGSMLPTVVIANLMSSGAAARCGQLNIGDQLIAINGLSLVGLPLSTCQTYIKNTKNQTVVKFTVVPCAPVVEVKIKRPNTKYQLGFSVQNGVICSLLRGGIAERGGVRVGHRIIEINNQSVVAVPHEKIVNLLATSVGEILMKTMPTSMFRLLTGQENPIYI